MKKILSLICILLVAFTITSCRRSDVGMVTGGVVGGVAGSALTHGSAAGTIVGAVGGGLVGRELAR